MNFDTFIKSPTGIFSIIGLIILFIIYLIGLNKSRKNSIIIINNYFEYVVLIFATISLGFAIFSKSNIELENYFYVSLVILILSISIVLYFSAISNKGNIQNICIAFFSKLFIILIIAFVFILRALELINASNDKNKNRRYKDGTKGNLIIAAHNRNRKYSDLLIRSLIHKS